MNKDNIYRWYAQNFAKVKFRKWNTFLFNLSVRGLGVLNYYDFKISGEDFFLNKFLKSHSIKTVFDVGANQGEYAAYFSDQPVNVYCFEPNPETFIHLENRFANKSNVHLSNFGLSNESKETIIYDTLRDDGSKLATIYKEVMDDLFQYDTKELPIALRTLDEFMSEQDIPAIDLLKIDTEGNEYRVLEGAREAIASGRIKIIHFEFNFMNVVSKSFMKDFMRLLPNYRFYRLLPDALLRIYYHRPLQNELFAFQNIIALRDDLIDE